MSGWRLSVLAHEALANSVAAARRTMVLSIGLAVLLGALVWVELSFTEDVKAQAQRFEGVVEGEDGIDAARCEALRWAFAVIAAGGFSSADDLMAANSPGTYFSQFEVTGDLVKVWDPVRPVHGATGYMVGLAAARELGLSDGGWLALQGGGGGRVEVINPAPRNGFASRAIMERVVPTGRISQCWVEFRPDYYRAGVDWLPAHFGNDQVHVRRVVSLGEFGAEPQDMLAGRPQRFGWLPAGLVGAMLLVVNASFRRSETALYRAFGVSRTGLYIMYQCETCVLVLVSYTLAMLWVVAAYAWTSGLPGPDQLWIALRTATLAACVATFVGPIGAVVASRGSPAALLKER
jgi:hypothetical protein